MRPTRLVLAACFLALVAASGFWLFGRQALSRRHDVAARRSVYGAFPTVPGATKDHERSYEVQGGDGGGTGRYGLAVTYRIPATTSPDVLGFLRANIPAGWHEASDETCARLQARMPAPPPAAPNVGSPPLVPPTTVSRAPLVLTRRPDELTVFTPHGDDAADGRLNGVTFTVSRTGQDVMLVLDQPVLGCQPASQGP